MAYVYPTRQELRTIESEKLKVLTLDDPIFQIIPIENVDSAILKWTQGDDVRGLQQGRGLNGQPSRVQRLGSREMIMQAGAYGEFIAIDETELTLRGDAEGRNVDITDLVIAAQEQLQVRFVDRVRWIGWQSLQGSVNVLGPRGESIYADTFAMQTAAAATPWSNAANSTPMLNLRQWGLTNRGKGYDYGAGAKAYTNKVTVNNLLGNTNPNDLGGKRVGTGSTLTGLPEYNRILAGEGLPEIVEYDGGYLDEAGVFVPFIPDNRLLLVGRRASGAALGRYAMTRNANNPNGAAGQYTKVVTKGIKEDEAPPALIEVHNGHNGGPCFEFPGAVIICTV